QIFSINLATMTESQLSDGSGNDYAPQYSADGSQIVFYGLHDNENAVIYLMNADGSNATAISDTAGNAKNPVWSDDGQFIAYQSNLDGDEDIYIFDLNTQQTHQLTDNQLNDTAPAWACNSHTLIFNTET